MEKITLHDGYFRVYEMENLLPDIEGKSTVYALFSGRESYWPSQAEIVFAVGVAEPTPSPYPVTVLPSTENYIIGSTVAIIIAIAIVGVLLLRKRPFYVVKDEQK